MPFANFYISDNEITKQFKGCYRQFGPSPGTRGTLSGSWIPYPINVVRPFKHNKIPGLWIFGGYGEGYFKMVGMLYGENGAAHKRVDGRAISLWIEIAWIEYEGSLNDDAVTALWDEAEYKDIAEKEYKLDIFNDSPLKSINQCLEETYQDNNTIFSVQNMNNNGLAQCVIGNNGETPTSSLLENVDEPECLTYNDTSTVFSVKTPKDSKQTLGKMYLGKSHKGSEQMVFHEYPSSLLTMGEKYHKVENHDSPDHNLINDVITDSTSEQCLQYCLNRGQDCKGIVYDKVNKSCSLKSEIYPISRREINKSKDIYTRMPNIKNDDSCPNEVKAVSTNFLNKGGILSSEQMSLDFQCETEAEIKEQSLQLDAHANLDASYRMLSQDVSGLRAENERIIKGFDQVQKDVQHNMEEYNTTKKTIDHRIASKPRVDKLYSDSRQLGAIFSFRNTGLVLTLLLLSIILVRVLRK